MYDSPETEHAQVLISADDIESINKIVRLNDIELEDHLDSLTPNQIAQLTDRVAAVRDELDRRHESTAFAVGRISETAHALVNGVRLSQQPKMATEAYEGNSLKGISGLRVQN
jgi:hypothetical protein